MDTIEFDYLDREFIELDCIQASLEHLFDRVNENGVNKNSIQILETLSQETFNPEYPIDSFTDQISEINKEVALEGILKGIYNGIMKVVKFIFKLLAAFFEKISQVFKWLAGADKERTKGDANSRQEIVIQAIQTNSKEVKVNRISFENKINNQVVSGITTERLLMMSYDDNETNRYKNIKDIMDGFFKKGLDNTTWEEIVNNRSSTLIHLIDYIREWWNTTHPIVVNPTNTTNAFVNDIAEAVDYTVSKMGFRLRWWITELKDLIKFDKASLTEEVEKLNIRQKLEYVGISENIIGKSNNALSLLPFVRTRVNDEITISLKNAFEEFKVAKVTPKSKIDFVKSLNKIEWVKDFKGLSKNIEKGKVGLMTAEKQMTGILNDIKGSIISSNREMTQSVNLYFKEIRYENRKLTTIAFSLLAFLVNTEKLVEMNRKKGAALHEMLIALGVAVEKDLKTD